ncbi:hypothetical protein FB45DRAFT_454225 [Roridomyces roridus]|uniref:Uncharacterized protein n=1 Tax=Roridomyces roridus TaxID=1738132 RepID=A0AAD7C2C5_9AGAR|nr:hypothetical protein FB45DRAFT_454225 [Roridomyces roridus]
MRSMRAGLATGFLLSRFDCSPMPLSWRTKGFYLATKNAVWECTSSTDSVFSFSCSCNWIKTSQVERLVTERSRWH